MNLPVVRYSKNFRLQIKQTAISDSIYKNLMNTNINSLCNALINEITHENDDNIFEIWNSEITKLI